MTPKEVIISACNSLRGGITTVQSQTSLTTRPSSVT